MSSDKQIDEVKILVNEPTAFTVAHDTFSVRIECAATKPFDWATATPEEKVKRRWPNAFETRMHYIWTSLQERACRSDEAYLGLTWQEAARHPSVLELERRETAKPITASLVSAYVAAEGDLDLAERLAAQSNEAQGEVELPPLDVTEEDIAVGLARGIPASVQPNDLMDIGGWWKKLFGWMGGAICCRDRQLRAALSELARMRKGKVESYEERKARIISSLKTGLAEDGNEAGFNEWWPAREQLLYFATEDQLEDFRTVALETWTAALASRADVQAKGVREGEAVQNNSLLTIEDMKQLRRAAFWCDKYVSHRTGEESLPHPDEAEAASKAIYSVLDSAGPLDPRSANEYGRGFGAEDFPDVQAIKTEGVREGLRIAHKIASRLPYLEALDVILAKIEEVGK